MVLAIRTASSTGSFAASEGSLAAEGLAEGGGNPLFTALAAAFTCAFLEGATAFLAVAKFPRKDPIEAIALSKFASEGSGAV